MTQPSRAVFLSYASQDKPAAKKICEALRTGRIEVWFDQRELRGGDAWDQRIRRELQDCALFIPVISANTAARHEGYFRLEWHLADQRTHMIARNRAFIVPVCIDATLENGTDAPESFQRVQWTRLIGGETPTAFVERIQRLLSGEDASGSDRVQGSGTAQGGVASTPRRLIRRRTGALGVAITAALVLALGYMVYERLPASRPGVPDASIAVLPLANESGDPSQQYFSDGMSEDLITALAQFPGLKVIGRNSAFQFRDTKEDSRSIGAKLGVAHLLEGSVRREGNLVRVSAELVDTADGGAQWSQHYDRPYQDLFALQDEITRAVAGALRARLLPGAEPAAAQSDRPPGGSLEAYHALLQGEFYMSRYTEADLRKAAESYNQAIELDPDYALAWSALSGVWSSLGATFLAGEAARDAYAKAHEAADRAVALSPELAAAHVARGVVLQVADFDWRGAEAEFHRAMVLAPNDGEAKFYFGRQLAFSGNLEPAIEFTQQALGLEPLQANWYESLATYLSGLNRLNEAERAILRAIELQPDAAAYYQRLAIIEVQRGNAQGALDAARHVPANARLLALTFAQQINGDQNTADAALRALIENAAMWNAYQIAEIYALRNDASATFEWLDRAWSNRDPGIGHLLFDPFILRYKDDARFADFCRKVGLPVTTAARARKSN